METNLSDEERLRQKLWRNTVLQHANLYQAESLLITAVVGAVGTGVSFHYRSRIWGFCAATYTVGATLSALVCIKRSEIFRAKRQRALEKLENIETNRGSGR